MVVINTIAQYRRKFVESSSRADSAVGDKSGRFSICGIPLLCVVVLSAYV